MDLRMSCSFVFRAALGTIPYKVPALYTEKLFALATPPFHPNYPVDKLITRNITPPYLSNLADVQFMDLASLGAGSHITLILCSDGLRDLYHKTSNVNERTDSLQQWMFATAASNNKALSLLWDAIGGEFDPPRAGAIVQGQIKGRIDDTTILVCELK